MTRPLDPDKRFCPSCREFKLIASFGFNKWGKIRPKCFHCRAADRKLRELARIDNLGRLEVTRMVKQLHCQLDQKKRNIPAVSELVDEILSHFGTVKGFAKQYYTSILAAAPGSNTQLNAFRAVTQLLCAAHDLEGKTKDVEEMTEAELRAELGHLFRDYIRANRAVVVPEVKQLPLPAADLQPSQ